jgi:hypothetical protein
VKIRTAPRTKQLTWPSLMALPEGSVVRDLEGETGTVLCHEFEGKKFKRVSWDDGCITSLSHYRKGNSGIFLLRTLKPPEESQEPEVKP